MSIPVAGEEAWLGAAAYLAVLAYPRVNGKDDAKKDAFIEACKQYLSLWNARREGMQRVTARRRAESVNPWIQRPADMEHHEILRTINAAEERIRRRRFSCVQVAMQLALIQFEQEVGVPIVLGPRARYPLLERWAAKAGYAEEDLSTMKRHWEETLPVLHLAHAFYQHWIELAHGRSSESGSSSESVVIRAFRSAHLWLDAAVIAAEDHVDDLAATCGFDPTQRIKITSDF